MVGYFFLYTLALLYATTQQVARFWRLLVTSVNDITWINTINIWMFKLGLVRLGQVRLGQVRFKTKYIIPMTSITKFSVSLQNLATSILGCQPYSDIPLLATQAKRITMASIQQCVGGFPSTAANSEVRIDDVFVLIQARRQFTECFGCCFDCWSSTWS